MADSGDALSMELENLAILAHDSTDLHLKETELDTHKETNQIGVEPISSSNDTLFDIDEAFPTPVPTPQTPDHTQSTHTKTPSTIKKRFVGVQIPDDILHNGELNKAIDRLPKNYSFEIHKTIWRIRTANAKMVALQFPEGLLMYSCMIADILERFASVETLIMGDVTYGACCIDDFTARALGCDFMVHYGHSCLVPINVSQMNTLYVFVDILFTINHLVHMMQKNFDREAKIVLAGTIQFANALHAAKKSLEAEFPNILIPQAKPLSQGEILGCTSPHLPTMIADEKATKARLAERMAQRTAASQSLSRSCCHTKDTPTETTTNTSCCKSNANLSCTDTSKTSSSTLDTSCQTQQQGQNEGFSLFLDKTDNAPVEDGDYDICVFVADGRFHLESMMIHNPQIKAFYKYDPYNKMMTAEAYDLVTMHSVRLNAITAAKNAKRWGVVLGTLGRQGSTQLLERIIDIIRSRGDDYIVVLLSEIFPSKLAMFQNVDAWVQIACPRLSIDWGYAFPAPLLSTYEFDVAMGLAPWLPNNVYPMDFYSHLGGAWTNYYQKRQEVKRKAALATDGGRKAGTALRNRALLKRKTQVQPTSSQELVDRGQISIEE